MDPISATIRGVFRDLSRMCDGNHIVYLRTDPQSFVEFHSGGASNVYTSTIAALMPNVVIKLQTPMVPHIISAVSSQQELLHPPSRLFPIELQRLSDILDVAKQEQAAVIREDATLAVWASDLQTALANLQRILTDLEESFRVQGDAAVYQQDMAHYDTMYTPSEHDSLQPFDFDQFLDMGDKEYYSIARTTLPPLGTLDGMSTLDGLYPLPREHSFESFPTSTSTESPMLGDSPSSFMASMSQLRLNNTPHASPSFSPIPMPFDFSSPASSSGSTSESLLSTPMTIAPSVLSSPHSWNSVPLSHSPALSMLSEPSYEERIQDALNEQSPALSSSSPLAPAAEIMVNSPGKRKRFMRAQMISSSTDLPTAVQERPCARLPSRSFSGKTPASPTPLSRRLSGKSPKVLSSPSPAPERPLPGRLVRSASHSSVTSTSFRAVSSKLASPPHTEHDDDGEESSADEGSDYEADKSSDDDEEYVDEEFRPSKRTRSAPSSHSTENFVSSSATVRRKASSPKIAASHNADNKKKTKTRKHDAFGSSKKRRKASPSPSKAKPQCPWCDKVFTREGDVERHEKKSCKYYPFDQERDRCPDCGKDVSRHDAMLRHLGSDDCLKRQRENAARQTGAATVHAY